MILKDALKEKRFAFFDRLSILLECLISCVNHSLKKCW
jgi:hypothetical protein